MDRSSPSLYSAQGDKTHSRETEAAGKISKPRKRGQNTRNGPDKTSWTKRTEWEDGDSRPGLYTQEGGATTTQVRRVRKTTRLKQEVNQTTTAIQT